MSLLHGSRTGDDHSTRTQPDDLAPPRPNRRDQSHDWAIRYLVENDLPAWCDFLNIKLTGPGERLSGELPRTTRNADLLVRVGPNRLLHTEYLRTLERDAYLQMLDYRALIMRRYPETRLTQCAVLLGNGKMRMYDDPENGFSLGLKILSLPSIDRDEFLRRPSLSPLAALASGDQATRKGSVIAALRLIEQFPPERQSGMREAALNLASISLEPATFNAIRKELGMSLEEVATFYED